MSVVNSLPIAGIVSMDGVFLCESSRDPDSVLDWILLPHQKHTVKPFQIRPPHVLVRKKQGNFRKHNKPYNLAPGAYFLYKRSVPPTLGQSSGGSHMV